MADTAPTFTPEEITLANWLGDDEAKSILRSMAFNAPTYELTFDTYVLTRDEYLLPTGRRWDRLKAIWDRYHAAVWDYIGETGDQRLAEYFLFEMPRPEAAVSAMLSLAPLIERVAVMAKVRGSVAGERARAA